jgi:misacylated tRNA(Ala) deacylase
VTELLFRDDAYLRQATAEVVAIEEDGGIVLDRTPFYPQGGGQPGDSGKLSRMDGTHVKILTTRYGADKPAIAHVPGPDSPILAVGNRVKATLDWDKRLKRMRVHTALHLLTAVLPYPVTGGAIGDGEGRLDFDIPDAGLDRADVEAKLNALIARNADVRTQWITDDELLANPGLVKTMSVKPPMGSGRVRLVEIVGLDLQPCGGTHVARTDEIGRAAITAIEKKGKQNRRVRLVLAD